MARKPKKKRRTNIIDMVSKLSLESQERLRLQFTSRCAPSQDITSIISKMTRGKMNAMIKAINNISLEKQKELNNMLKSEN